MQKLVILSGDLDINFNWLMLLGWYLVLFWVFIKVKSRFNEKEIDTIN